MKQLYVLIFFVSSAICLGQIKDYQDIDFKFTKEIKGLVYFKADLTLVTGRVIRYNNKKEAKRYIIVRNGKPDASGWIFFNEKYESPKESTLGTLIAATGVVTGGALFFSGNKRFPIPNSNDVKNNNKKLLENETSDLIDYNKEIATKANDNMLKRNEYLENKKNRPLEITVNEINTKKHELSEDYHSNGNSKSKGLYIEGEKDGHWEDYYENGQLKRIINFKSGKKDGIWKQYHPNTKLWCKGYFKDGEKIGEWLYYDENGNLYLTENYDN